jgi:two-component system, chemotaxis family, protein-glutamate methylesterase/glutaminase
LIESRSDDLQYLGKNKGNAMDQPSREPGTPRLIGIVSATGGFEAMEVILGNLPREFPVPILVIPGIHPLYVEQLAARLDAKSPLQVTVAEDAQMPEPGRVYLVANDQRLIVVQGRLRLVRENPPDYHREPKNALFRSMARDQGSGALAVILTGMGSDGAEGMGEVRDAGGYTIVQDEPTSIVYGPARLAVQLNAACESLPVQEIAPRLVTLVASGQTGLK